MFIPVWRIININTLKAVITYLNKLSTERHTINTQLHTYNTKYQNSQWHWPCGSNSYYIKAKVNLKHLLLISIIFILALNCDALDRQNIKAILVQQ